MQLVSVLIKLEINVINTCLHIKCINCAVESMLLGTEWRKIIIFLLGRLFVHEKEHESKFHFTRETSLKYNKRTTFMLFVHSIFSLEFS